jgi:hypothetical protein
MKYFASIAAYKFTGQGMFLDHLPIRIEADSHDEANKKALDEALEKWPAKEGWQGHDAVSVLR